MIVRLEKPKFHHNVATERNVWTCFCEWQNYVDSLLQSAVSPPTSCVTGRGQAQREPQGRSSTSQISVENSRVTFSLDQRKTVGKHKWLQIYSSTVIKRTGTNYFDWAMRPEQRKLRKNCLSLGRVSQRSEMPREVTSPISRRIQS